VKRTGRPPRAVYEEKKKCGRCGEIIVGVVPRKEGGKPLCRSCAYMESKLLEEQVTQITIDDTPPVILTPQEKAIQVGAWVALVLSLLFLFYRVQIDYQVFKPAQPHRLGTYETNAGTDKCIEELWQISRMMQDGKLTETMPLCPVTLKSYVMVKTDENTVITCPNPGEHGIENLYVSRKSPVPVVVTRVEK